MVDSIHFARWLEQFKNEEIKFTIIPSRRYKKLNFNLKILINSKNMASYSLSSKVKINFFQGYIDFLLHEILGKFVKNLSREFYLKKLVSTRRYDYIHALEVQSAGYLLQTVPRELLKKSPTILTNWGSELVYYGKLPNHSVLIKKLLDGVDYFSAECRRDYGLANQLGFRNKLLPCIPAGGGYDIEQYRINLIKPSERFQILVKGYGGLFGRADLVINAITAIYLQFPEFNYFIYSATKDVLKIINRLPSDLKMKIKFSSLRNPLTHSQIIDEFLKSRVYIGCSESDGISTSFLESLLTGAFPIQSNTSCANEWIMKGAQASIIPLDSDVLIGELKNALMNDSLVDTACEKNYLVARKHLSFENVKKEALKFYNISLSS